VETPCGRTCVSALMGLVVCGVGLWLGIRTPSHRSPAPLVREASHEPSTEAARLADAAKHGHRGAPLPKVALRRTSTRATVLLVLACLSFTAAALPFAVHLPRWVEAEVVLGAWWLTWSVVLAVLAYRGKPLDETHRLEIRAPFASSAPVAVAPPPAPARTRTRWFDCFDLGSAVDAEGCLLVLAVGIVVGIALAAAWLVVELAAPALFFLAYLGVARSLRRALAASHRGDAFRSARHGAVWATAYVAPLAAVIALVHTVLAAR
jgi:hypothetical protein